MKKLTKIVATVSDRQCSKKLLKDMFKEGVDVVRLNTAHQQPEDTLGVIEHVRAVSQSVGIMVDIKGPEVRTRDVHEDLNVQFGDTLLIGKKGLQVSYPRFVEEVPEGAVILIDDGLVELIVDKKTKTALHCVVKNAGVIKNNKSVNVPGVSLRVPSLTEKDKQYIPFCCKHNVDFIAVSFVRNKEDLLAVKKRFVGKHKPQLVAKIESQEGIDHIEEILDHSYSVMIARGDLGVEVPPQDVPLLQKKLIQTCMVRRRPVITATQMLQSMIDNPRPTRAEVSDVANAVLDGTDALMLSGETAYGEYPVQSVRVMANIARSIEAKKHLYKRYMIRQAVKGVREHFVKAAIPIATESDVAGLVVPTMGGSTVRSVAAYRPKLPVYAMCKDDFVKRLLSLSYGVTAHTIGECFTTGEMFDRSLKLLVKEKVLKKTDLVMVLGNTPLKEKEVTNFMEVNTVKGCLALRERKVH